ncbi:MAG: DAK2 domain-containing protein [Pseudomonadota bacterium]
MMDRFLTGLVDRFEGLEAELNRLDSAIGDGDHGTTILKGIRAAAKADGPAAKAFRVAAGGASGSLFSLLIGALEKVGRGQIALGEGLSDAADRISQMGEAKLGDKTMLDALIPASEAALAHQENAAGAAAEAAKSASQATASLAAKRGRAKYVEGAGVGHIDPGAVSVAVMLEEFERLAREAV